MSAPQEKRAEDVLKSKHKKAKRSSVIPPADAPSPSAEHAATLAASEGAPSEKKSKKDKKAKKRASEDADGKAAEQDDIAPAEDAPAKKKAKVEPATNGDAAEDPKEAKRRRKEEKRAKKAAAGETGTSAATPAGAASADADMPVDESAARAFLESNNITIQTPDGSVARPMLAFDELSGKIDKRLRQMLDAEGFKAPTPIQACCWPVLLRGKDVVGIAETGSGKTFAFGLPALQHIASLPNAEGGKKKGKKGGSGEPISVLVVAPTRELAIQTHENLEKLGSAMSVGSVCLYGGVSKQDQQRALASSSQPVRIVVGTPGRILDLAREGVCDLSTVSYLVLDEADRMLDKGFENDIRAIIGMTRSHTEGRFTSMFSATWPPSVRQLAETFMQDPVRVTVGSDELSANRRVEQTVEVLDDGRMKEHKLSAFLRSVGAGGKGKGSNDRILIFALYKKEAQRVEQNLRRSGHRVSGIHGDMGQHERMASLDRFKTAETPLLVATDVAARGLDIPNVEYVVNYTFPLTIEDYVHRIGRTGRGGKTGKSITFFTEEDKAHAGELMRVLKDAGQAVPDEMNRFPTTIKKKTHGAYGDHFKEFVPGKAKKITFD